MMCESCLNHGIGKCPRCLEDFEVSDQPFITSNMMLEKDVLPFLQQTKLDILKLEGGVDKTPVATTPIPQIEQEKPLTDTKTPVDILDHTPVQPVRKEQPYVQTTLPILEQEEEDKVEKDTDPFADPQGASEEDIVKPEEKKKKAKPLTEDEQELMDFLLDHHDYRLMPHFGAVRIKKNEYSEKQIAKKLA